MGFGALLYVLLFTLFVLLWLIISFLYFVLIDYYFGFILGLLGLVSAVGWLSVVGVWFACLIYGSWLTLGLSVYWVLFVGWMFA